MEIIPFLPSLQAILNTVAATLMTIVYFHIRRKNTAVHRALMTVSGGRIGWTAADMPVLELTTTGRKSGQPRSCMLTSPWQDGDTMAIVASRGGDDRHPAWFLNVSDREANPEVYVKTRREAFWARADVLPDDERATVWEQLVRDRPFYVDYQAKTTRQIPLVRLVKLRPAETAPPG